MVGGERRSQTMARKSWRNGLSCHLRRTLGGSVSWGLDLENTMNGPSIEAADGVSMARSRLKYPVASGGCWPPL